MNTIIVKTIPLGDYQDISIETHKEADVIKLILDNQLLKYEVCDWPNLSPAVKEALDKRRYRDIILESNHDTHYLIPPVGD